jgi:2-oxoglutarate dehydrogenase E1 component
LHVVINNQVGFTTEPDQGRSTTYATDIAKMLEIPIFHVNGEDPEAVAQVVALAMDFRKQFEKDVVIDMYAYRKLGHNESDEPRFTQPLMYAAIDAKTGDLPGASVEHEWDDATRSRCDFRGAASAVDPRIRVSQKRAVCV